MARAADNKGRGWDFLKVGKVYQYKEGPLVAMVEVLEDNSDEDFYRFKIVAKKAAYNIAATFVVTHNKRFHGYWSDMPQFYPEGHEEYVMLPIGTPYPFIFE